MISAPAGSTCGRGSIATMRPSSTSSEPADRIRSGRTRSPPANTIIGGYTASRLSPWLSGEHRRTRSADRGRLRAERGGDHLYLMAGGGRNAAHHLLPRGIEQQVVCDRHDATKHHHVGIENGDEVRQRHADVFRGVADHGDRHAVAITRGGEYLLDADGGEVAACHVGHA